MGNIAFCSTPMGSPALRAQVIEDRGQFFAAVRFDAWDTGPLYQWPESFGTVRVAAEMAHVHRAEMLLWQVEAV